MFTVSVTVTCTSKVTHECGHIVATKDIASASLFSNIIEMVIVADDGVVVVVEHWTISLQTFVLNLKMRQNKKERKLSINSKRTTYPCHIGWFIESRANQVIIEAVEVVVAKVVVAQHQ